MPTRLPITETYMPQFFSSTDTKLGIVHKLKRVLYSISLTANCIRLFVRIVESESCCTSTTNTTSSFS